MTQALVQHVGKYIGTYNRIALRNGVDAEEWFAASPTRPSQLVATVVNSSVVAKRWPNFVRAAGLIDFAHPGLQITVAPPPVPTLGWDEYDGTQPMLDLNLAAKGSEYEFWNSTLVAPIIFFDEIEEQLNAFLQAPLYQFQYPEDERPTINQVAFAFDDWDWGRNFDTQFGFFPEEDLNAPFAFSAAFILEDFETHSQRYDVQYLSARWSEDDQFSPFQAFFTPPTQSGGQGHSHHHIHGLEWTLNHLKGF